MDEYEHNLFYADEEKVLEYCKSIIRAVEKTREVAAKSRMICRKAAEALETGDKHTMWEVLQEYLHKYATLFTAANGVQIKRVNAEFYSSVTEDDIAKQLRIVIGLIYSYEAKHCAAKETIKTCFKKILKESGVFSNAEIELILL